MSKKSSISPFSSFLLEFRLSIRYLNSDSRFKLMIASSLNISNAENSDGDNTTLPLHVSLLILS